MNDSRFPFRLLQPNESSIFVCPTLIVHRFYSSPQREVALCAAGGDNKACPVLLPCRRHLEVLSAFAFMTAYWGMTGSTNRDL